MKLPHILSLLSLLVVSVFSSDESQAASEIRPCVHETCTSDAARIKYANDFGLANGNGVHKLYFFNTETKVLHSYRVDNEFDQESKLNFVRTTAYNSTDKFKDYVKAVYSLESDIYGTLGLETPITINRQHSTRDLADVSVDATMHIRVDADDHYWLEAKAIDARAIGARLEAIQASAKKTKLIVESHHSATNEALIFLLNTAKSVGLKHVTITTYE